MSQEVLIPKMKRLEKKRFKIPFLSFALVVLGLLLIIFSTFIGFELKHYIFPISAISGKTIYMEDYIYSTFYIPQIPIVIFTGAAFGKKIGVFSVLLYILLGVFALPLFALGGGIGYIWEYSFGYILAYVPVLAIGTSVLEKRYSFKNMFLFSVFGVMTIHFLGIIYMTIIAIIKQDGLSFISGWIASQSGLKIVYDCIGSFVLITIGKFIYEQISFLKN